MTATPLTLSLASALAVFALFVASPAQAASLTSDAAPAKGESITGTLTGPNDKPVPKVTITVSDQSGPVGKATTARDGTWKVPLPKPGTYTVTIDTESLPQSVQMRTEGGKVLKDVRVTPGSTRTVIFPLIPANAQQESAGGTSSSTEPTDGSDDGGGGDDDDGSFAVRAFQRVLDGLRYGVIIAITAVGLSLVFGTTKLINFAHGEMVTIGAFVAYFLSTSAFNVPLIAAAIVAMIVGALVAASMERGIYRPMRSRGTGRIQLFIISIGLSLLLRHILLIMFGSRRQQYDQYAIQSTIDLGPIHITPRDLTVTLVSVAVLLGVAFMLMRTRMGKAARAVADNKDLAEASGIDVDRIILVVWVLGGALAALGGVMYGLSTAVFWNMGFNLLLLMFAGVILGGLGSAFGAVVGSLVVGVVAHVSTLWFDVELQNAWALLTLIVVLLIRPQGILGRAERKG